MDLVVIYGVEILFIVWYVVILAWVSLDVYDYDLFKNIIDLFGRKVKKERKGSWSFEIY